MDGLVEKLHESAIHNGRLKTIGVEYDSDVGTLIDDICKQLRIFGTGRQGVVIAISLPTSAEFIASVIAVWLAGFTGTAIGTRASHWEISKSLSKTTPLWLIRSDGDTRFLDFEETSTPVSRHYRLAVARLRGGAPHLQLGRQDGWLASTSGSTGAPKHAVLTYANLMHNATETARILSLDAENDRVLAFTPANFSYALNQALSALLLEVPVVFWPHGLAAPSELWAAIQQNRTTVLSANPTSFEILLRADRSDELVEIRQLMSGGQPLNAGLATRLASAMPNCHIFSAYGCSEYVNRITYKQYAKRDLVAARGTLPVGRPIGDTSVDLRSTATGAAEVVLSGRSLMRGYLDEITSTSSQISSFATGDIAEWDADGDLILTGRVKTLINIANEMVSPEEIEAVAKTVPGVKECAVASTKNELLGESIHALLSVELDRSPEEVTRKVKREWQTKLSRIKQPSTLEIVPDEEIPRTEYGKVDRVALAQKVSGQGGAQ